MFENRYSISHDLRSLLLSTLEIRMEAPSDIFFSLPCLLSAHGKCSVFVERMRIIQCWESAEYFASIFSLILMTVLQRCSFQFCKWGHTEGKWHAQGHTASKRQITPRPQPNAEIHTHSASSYTSIQLPLLSNFHAHETHLLGLASSLQITKQALIHARYSICQLALGTLWFPSHRLLARGAAQWGFPGPCSQSEA